MKTYIINLEASTRRRANVLREVRDQGLDHEIVTAVDGTQISNEELDRLPIADCVRTNSYYTRTIVGAAMSHVKVYKKILASGDETALILEDDAVLCDGFGDVLGSIRSRIKPNEIILCHYMSVETISLSNVDSQSLAKGYDLYHPLSLRCVNSGAGYVITRGAVEKLLKTVVPMQAEADSWKAYYEQGGFDSIRFVYPMPIRVRGDKSTIAADSQSRLRRWLTTKCDDYRLPPFYQILRAVRLRSVANRSCVVRLNRAPDFDSRMI